MLGKGRKQMPTLPTLPTQGCGGLWQEHRSALMLGSDLQN